MTTSTLSLSSRVSAFIDTIVHYLWNVWMSRIVVTLSIIILLDIFVLQEPLFISMMTNNNNNKNCHDNNNSIINSNNKNEGKNHQHQDEQEQEKNNNDDFDMNNNKKVNIVKVNITMDGDDNGIDIDNDDSDGNGDGDGDCDGDGNGNGDGVVVDRQSINIIDNHDVDVDNKNDIDIDINIDTKDNKKSIQIMEDTIIVSQEEDKNVNLNSNNKEETVGMEEEDVLTTDRSSSIIQQQQQRPPRIKSNTNKKKKNAHPGMDGFVHWYDVETSLYRIYTLTRHDNVEVVPPYVPHSYRGKISIALHVTNDTNFDINIYWVDYKGKYVLKGHLTPHNRGGRSSVWTQTTWIDHPWVFENASDSTPLLYYVPYRVIPTLPGSASTATSDDGTIGLHKFKLIPPSSSSSSSSSSTDSTVDPFYIGIQDDIMPFPATKYFLHQPYLSGINWTLIHMSRYFTTNQGELLVSYVDTLQKYLWNIIHHPETVKYRQIRTSSLKFNGIWNTPTLRGLLLCIGFVEVGPNVELGNCHNDEPLSSDRIQDIALVSYKLNEWKITNTNLSSSQQQRQPMGAGDGYGRAGFGRAGSIN